MIEHILYTAYNMLHHASDANPYQFKKISSITNVVGNTTVITEKYHVAGDYLGTRKGKLVKVNRFFEVGFDEFVSLMKELAEKQSIIEINCVEAYDPECSLLCITAVK